MLIMEITSCHVSLSHQDNQRRTTMSSLESVLITLLSLSAITTNANIDNAWYTYVDRVESVREQRAIQESATQSPMEMTTPHNTTEIVHDNHDYYTVEYKPNEDGHWMDIDNLGSPLVINQRLSATARHAVKVQLNFTYPFYGYDTRFLYVTSSGFLYLGSYSHRYLSATQYVAPLMADFDPSLDVGSTISYFGDESMFVTEWRNLRLQKDTTGKNFTFQATLYKNGTTVFSYKEKPLNISDIPTKNHPVKVGLADAYYHDTWMLHPVISRRVIYEYHSVDASFSKVDESSSIVIRPLETCTSRLTCSTCIDSPPTGFVCVWCNALNKCSDGFDRQRQAWVKQHCDTKNQTVCPAESKPDENEDICLTLTCGPGTCTSDGCLCPDYYFGQQCQTYKKDGDKAGAGSTTSSSHAPAVLFFLFLIILVVVLAGWAVYAYKNPNTTSGLFLIKVTRCYCLKGSSGNSPSYKYEKTRGVNI
ncbi:plexin domain-containing protein 1-like isoform X3 [Apostichopus japonicus]|uniref:plexin domain-containing protein 1-like isoform X3 n=1 Tax=Stichopus japonicus TaxID=307972 RepID=UPI003AB3B616